MNNKKDILENIVGLIVVLVVIVFAVIFFDFENLQSKILEAGVWGPIILIALKASTIVFAPLSGSPLYPIAGAVFGFWSGLIYIVIGDALGSVIAFAISRRLGQKIVERMLSKRNMPSAKKVIHVMETTGGFLFARVCFAAMPEIVAYAAGLTKIKFSKFFIINFLVGLIPATILVFGGNFVVLLKNPVFMIGFVVVGLLVVLGGGLIFVKYTKHIIFPEDLPAEKDEKNPEKSEEKNNE